MKRINNLFEKIVDIDNLYLAVDNAKKNKGNRADIIEFLQNKDKLILELQQQLINGTYVTSPYKTFKIYEPKERVIYKLPFYPDRIVHHAIMNILEPVWLSVFINNTYSCIKNRGIHKALEDVKKALKDVDNTEYCLKMDIRKFYPSIDHDNLKSIIRKKIKDRRLLQLLDEIIDSTDGVPIGNYLSQFFANLFITYMDHYIKEQLKVKYYFRYADDIVVLGKDKNELRNIQSQIIQYLNGLKLQVKDNYQIFRVEDRGISFVGYVIRHNYTRLRRNIKSNMCKRSARLLKKRNMNQKKYKIDMCSYTGWAKFCNAKNLLKTIDKKQYLTKAIS